MACRVRYLIDPEYRVAKSERTFRAVGGYAGGLRCELSERNQQWARDHGVVHEVTLGGVPAVLYQEDEQGRHGNFLKASYERICAVPAWRARLSKVHTSAKRALLSRDGGRRELDSSNSSDALLMNIFCHPETLAAAAARRLLGVGRDAEPVFGYRPRVKLVRGLVDYTEVDMKLDDLLVEAKLTEFDFQQAPRRMVERYPRFAEVFDVEHDDLCGERVESYQLIRGVLAADASSVHRFCVLCDARRPDLMERWHRLLSRVTIYDLRCRMVMLTWQELASVLPEEMQEFLEEKYGICAAA